MEATDAYLNSQDDTLRAENANLENELVIANQASQLITQTEEIEKVSTKLKSTLDLKRLQAQLSGMGMVILL